MSSELRDKINQADRLAALWRQGQAAAIVLEDCLTLLGFERVEVMADKRIKATLNGVEFPI